MEASLVKTIRESEDFSHNPIKLICDNMILVWDNVKGNPGIIWDDEKECCYWLYENSGNYGSGDVQDAYPFVIKVIPYEMIQYIDIILPPTDAYNYIEKYKDKMVGSEEDLKRLYSTAIGKRSYTGTISEYPHRDIRKPLSSD